MTSAVPGLHYEARDGLATISFDRPESKVNLLSSDVMLRLDELLAGVEDAAKRGEVRALLVRSGKRRNFIAGADIDELARFESAAEAAEISRRGQQIFMRLEKLPVPTLAAIAGTCVGGGLELVLSCDYRVASDHPGTRLGLPETQLGILPGLGGTVRLPRLIGLQPALDMILTGRQVSASRARRLGLVDRVIDDEGFDAAVEEIGSAFAAGTRPLAPSRRSLFARLVKDGAPARWIVLRMARKATLARTRGHYPALPEALQVTVAGLGLSAEEAHAREAEAFGRLAATPESKNLIHVYYLREGARKRVPDGEATHVDRAAVVGAGLMGAGIAELLAYQSIPVRVVDIDEETVDAGLEKARELLAKAAERAGWSDEDLQARTGCLRGSTDYEGFEKADLVVEAVVERMDIKKGVFERVENYVRPTAVVATNTSALSVSELQEGMKHPERVCGLHFFNPPYRMPLVEVVRGARTSADAMATAFELATRLGKTPVAVKDSPGFVVNRILAAYLTEAGHLLHSGMPVKQLDRLMTRFGMPVGPARLLDEIGLAVVAEVGRTMEAAFGERFATAPAVRAVFDSGVTGRKGGSGFYLYKKGKSRGVNPAAETILREAAAGDSPATASSEAEERIIFSMVNEAARTLDDGVVETPEEIDIAMIMGTGFPPFHGGLLRYADSLGARYVAERLRIYAETVDARFEPAAGLSSREKFYTA
jgi:3-hydroxyacyl-CoA dehydrogenase/enoyl-CoA hydratase/3-hydroxybutyryl-CoA epimerase